MDYGQIFSALLTNSQNSFNSQTGRKQAEWDAMQQRNYNTLMYERMLADSRADAETAWNRSLDYKSKVDAARAAGINPYAIMGAGMSTQAPVARGGSYAGYQRPDTTAISMQQNQMLMQSQLVQAQIANINANTKKTETETEGEKIKNRYAGAYTEAQINQVISATESAQQTKKLLEQQTMLTNRQGLAAEIDNWTRWAQNQADLAKTEAEKRRIMKDMAVMDQTMAKMKAEIVLIQQQVEMGKMSVKEGEKRIEKMTTEIEDIKQTRQPRINQMTRPGTMWNVPQWMAENLAR